MADSRNEKITKGKIEFWKTDVIGETPTSVVFKGTFIQRISNAAAGKRVAVKRIPLDLAELAGNEIKVLLEISDHNNVVKYYHIEEDGKFCYIAMERCNCNLEEYIEKKGNYSPRLPNTPIEEILQGAAEGLSHIHKKNIIHRDIKPSNILLFVKDDKLVAKISDFGISHIIPDHHTVSGNFSAGTDLYMAPELLTPSFSMRSDVYTFGLVVFYVLSKEKHLFGNNLGQIIEGNPVNLKKLNGQPTALSLVEWLTAFDQDARPTMSEVVHHPFFWKDEKKLNFIKDVHQITDNKENALLINEVIEEDSHHVICSSPENCLNQRTSPGPAACADWKHHLEKDVINDFRGKVNEKSCADLVRIIRNKLTHFYEIKGDLKKAYGGNIESFRRYWLDRFPSLVVHLWKKVEITHLTALLSGYFAPESVRRRNAETTLLRAIDEDELEDPQDLQNKIKRLGSTIWERALRFAVGKGRKEHVEVLLEDGTCPDVRYKDLINSLLDAAASGGHSAVAQLLIERGAEVNCKDKNGGTPLHYAAREGHSAVAQFLIERGAEVNCKDKKGGTPLHEAARWGHSAVAQLLIERDAEVNCKDKYGVTPLHRAVRCDRSAVAQLLIERGAEVNCKIKNGDTLLHAAADNGDSVVAELLIERGAEVTCKNRNGRTPLHSAAWWDRSAVAQLLIERGAEVNCKDENGETPLHAAARWGCSAVAQSLIELGAEVNCKNDRGRTPLDYAAEKTHTELIELLHTPPAENLPSEPNT